MIIQDETIGREAEEVGSGGAPRHETTGNSPGDNFPGRSPFIEPTVGRIVWFYHVTDKWGGKQIEGPLAAMVCGVISSRSVNLAVFSHTGMPFQVLGTYLLQEDDKPPEGRSYATWMPWQKAQVEKQGRAGW